MDISRFSKGRCCIQTVSSLLWNYRPFKAVILLSTKSTVVMCKSAKALLRYYMHKSLLFAL